MAGGEVILLSDSDDEDLPASKPAADNADTADCRAKVEAKVEGATSAVDSQSLAAADDEIEIVTASRATSFTAASKPAAKSSGGGDDSDDELEFLGAANEQVFPHNRQDCLEFRYKPGDVENNLKFCRLCYCWVCNKEASECDHWYRGEKGTCSQISDEADASASAADDNDEAAKSGNEDGKRPASDGVSDADSKPSAADDRNKAEKPDAGEPHENHCMATDKGPEKHKWTAMREKVKGGLSPSKLGTAAAASGGDASGLAHGASMSAAARAMADWQRRAFQDAGLAAAFARAQRANAAAASAAAAASRGRTGAGRARARSRSAPPPPTRRTRPKTGAGSRRPAPHDHRARIRTQQMLEELYK